MFRKLQVEILEDRSAPSVLTDALSSFPSELIPNLNVGEVRLWLDVNSAPVSDPTLQAQKTYMGCENIQFGHNYLPPWADGLSATEELLHMHLKNYLDTYMLQVWRVEINPTTGGVDIIFGTFPGSE